MGLWVESRGMGGVTWDPHLQEAERLVLKEGAVVLEAVEHNLEDARRHLIGVVFGEAKGVEQWLGITLLCESNADSVHL